MKTLTTFLAVFAISVTVASAGDVTGFQAPKNLGPTNESSRPNPHPNLAPQLGGILVDGPKYGSQMINPYAPASYGMGEKYLSAPSGREDLKHEAGPAAHHDAGGIKLFSLEF